MMEVSRKMDSAINNEDVIFTQLKKYQIPAKTFIVGEYLALQTRQGLVLSTLPGFEMRFEQKPNWNPNQPLPFHPESPAGLYFEKNKSQLSGYEISFYDPFLKNKKAGVGASTAQFLALYKVVNQNFTDGDLLSEYLNLFPLNNKPSGLDLVAQNHEGLSLIEKGNVEKLEWVFNDLSLLIFFTGHKVATHEHIAKLNEIKIDVFSEAYHKVKESFKAQESQKFIEGIQQYESELKVQGLMAQRTQELINAIKNHPEINLNREILATKGCGALGADTFLLVVDRGAKDKIKSTIIRDIFLGDESYFLSDEGSLA